MKSKKIKNIALVEGAFFGCSLYVASKGGIARFTETIALEFKEKK